MAVCGVADAGLASMEHPALPETGFNTVVGPPYGAVVAYRVWVGVRRRSPGTMQLRPVTRHQAAQPEKPGPIPLPARGEVLVIPAFRTSAHITIDVDMQYTLQWHDDGRVNAQMIQIDVYDMPRAYATDLECRGGVRRGLGRGEEGWSFISLKRI
jgi:hypothetical protein